ncbi:uncharacterized protein LOC111621292 [Centruroides sculpturatus]|uniref:uncharacterized protein LOC111621292 n=1 Tax=Centruroides sculpturatus TaxID=218467 RepID=UPI000C6E3A6B|nr:uncharacterized protein LOC111621292 [Centruroides sculpturatus]
MYINLWPCPHNDKEWGSTYLSQLMKISEFLILIFNSFLTKGTKKTVFPCPLLIRPQRERQGDEVRDLAAHENFLELFGSQDSIPNPPERQMPIGQISCPRDQSDPVTKGPTDHNHNVRYQNKMEDLYAIKLQDKYDFDLNTVKFNVLCIY